MVVLAFLEAYQLYLYMASGWFKVALIRSYITSPFLQTSYCSEMIIHLLLMLKAFRPWKGRLGQYCLLENLGRQSRIKNCLHCTTLRRMDKSKKGRKNSVKLSEDVKKAIIDSLLGSNGHLTNGVTSLQKNGVHACDATATDGAVTRTILVWHIATTLCEHQLDKEGKEGAQLARQIEGIQDSQLRWKVLSDFWAEMILYVSPSDDAWAHLELVARGGEFITHLWALLTHAGVLKQCPTGPKDVV
uniref:DUF4220 domain-containing protein n=1 Tax=Setaria viridis TaxID=4556 RepID=A0A4U6TGB4_SETVI|nr:hypothetical protein SEVIR_8G171200v2 [Setaria viridis]